jgi:uncharacterized protein DUF1236
MRNAKEERFKGWLPGASRVTWRISCRFAIAAAIALSCAAPELSQAQAQGPKAQGRQAQGPSATRTVKITLEQRHVIRELVRELKVNPSKEDLKIGEGDEVPGSVELQPVPPLIGQKVPQIKAHRLYVTARQILLVDPQDKRVVEVIE